MSVFDANPIRLDEFDGTLRRDVPPEYREPDGAWVLLRRYIPQSADRRINAETRELERTYVFERDPDGINRARRSEEQIEWSDAIGYRQTLNYIIDWSYGDVPSDNPALELKADGWRQAVIDVFEDIPSVHVNAILAEVNRLRLPRSDEDALKFRQQREGVLQVRNNGHAAGFLGRVHEDEGVGDPTP